MCVFPAKANKMPCRFFLTLKPNCYEKKSFYITNFMFVDNIILL